MNRGSVSRRVLLKKGSLWASGLVAGAVLSQGCGPERRAQSPDAPVEAASPAAARSEKMGYRRLGRTGLTVSEIVLAGHFGDPLVESSWSQFSAGDVPADVVARRTEVVARCVERGINCLDVTCGRDALACGAALKGLRDKVYISADDAEYAMRQNRHRNSESQMLSIESCLRKLKTDRIDIWRPQFKSQGGHRDVDLEMCVAVFEKARSQGKVRFLGMSTEDWPWMRRVVEGFPKYTVVYAPCPSQTASAGPGASEAQAPQSLLDAAKAKDVGVILAHPPVGSDPEGAKASLARVLGNPQVSAVAVDMNQAGDVDAIVQALIESRTPA